MLLLHPSLFFSAPSSLENRCREREFNFALNARGPIPPASSFTTIEDAERYLLPYRRQGDSDRGDDDGSSSDAGDADTDLDAGGSGPSPRVDHDSQDDTSDESGDDDGSVLSEDA